MAGPDLWADVIVSAASKSVIVRATSRDFLSALANSQ